MGPTKGERSEIDLGRGGGDGWSDKHKHERMFQVRSQHDRSSAVLASVGAAVALAREKKAGELVVAADISPHNSSTPHSSANGHHELGISSIPSLTTAKPIILRRGCSWQWMMASRILHRPGMHSPYPYSFNTLSLLPLLPPPPRLYPTAKGLLIPSSRPCEESRRRIPMDETPECVAMLPLLSPRDRYGSQYPTTYPSLAAASLVDLPCTNDGDARSCYSYGTSRSSIATPHLPGIKESAPSSFQCCTYTLQCDHTAHPRNLLLLLCSPFRLTTGQLDEPHDPADLAGHQRPSKRRQHSSLGRDDATSIASRLESGKF